MQSIIINSLITVIFCCYYCIHCANMTIRYIGFTSINITSKCMHEIIYFTQNNFYLSFFLLFIYSVNNSQVFFFRSSISDFNYLFPKLLPSTFPIQLVACYQLYLMLNVLFCEHKLYIEI